MLRRQCALYCTHGTIKAACTASCLACTVLGSMPARLAFSTSVRAAASCDLSSTARACRGCAARGLLKRVQPAAPRQLPAQGLGKQRGGSSDSREGGSHQDCIQLLADCFQAQWCSCRCGCCCSRCWRAAAGSTRVAAAACQHAAQLAAQPPAGPRGGEGGGAAAAGARSFASWRRGVCGAAARATHRPWGRRTPRCRLHSWPMSMAAA